MISKISVIIPVYNCEKYIYRCLKSVCGQNYSNLEIIVIDDGSTDSSYKICEKFSTVDKRVKVIRQSNQGVSKARKVGIYYSTGDYIAFVDSDDYLECDMYETMMKYKDNDCLDIVECGYKLVNENDEIISEVKLKEVVLEDKEIILEKYLNNEDSLVFLWNKLYNKKLFNNVELPEFAYSEDYLWNVILSSRCNKKISINYNGYIYLKNMNGACNDILSAKKIEGIYAGREAKKYLIENFDQMVKYAIKYTLQYELLIYNEFNNNGNNNAVLKQINCLFRDDFLLYNKYGVGEICSLTNRLAIKTFAISPHLYKVLYDLYLKIKYKNIER